MIAPIVDDPVALVGKEVRREVARFCAGCSDAGGGEGKQLRGFEAQLRAYERSLARISKCDPTDVKKWRALTDQLVFQSHCAKRIALMRAAARKKVPLSVKAIEQLAEGLDLKAALSEPIEVRVLPKDKGGFRVICSDGFMRTAQRLALRDVLAVSGFDSPIDFTRRGAGGEKAMVQAVCDAITQGVELWWTPDIRQFYDSLGPAHFGYLPIENRHLRNVVFTPKRAKLKVKLDSTTTSSAILQSYGTTYDVVCTPISKVVRQRLTQGSAVSPLLARGFLGRELQATLGAAGVVFYGHADDLAIGACTQKDAMEARDAVRQNLMTHPAGPLTLHDAGICNAHTGQVQVLGYRLEPGNNYKLPIHVKPGPLRINRFKRRLKLRLDRHGKDAEPHVLRGVTFDYWRRWYDSQTAWTKIPEFSELLSEGIASEYLSDYLRGKPMGFGSFDPQV